MGTLIKLLVVVAVIFGAYKVYEKKHRAKPHTFEVHGGEAYDAATNLTWQRCQFGQTYTGSGCEGGQPGYKFENARTVTQGPWRMPTEAEMKTLIDPDKADKEISPAIDNTVFPGINAGTPPFWTSSKAQGGGRGWYVRFNRGTGNLGADVGTYQQSGDNEYGMLLVREGR